MNPGQQPHDPSRQPGAPQPQSPPQTPNQQQAPASAYGQAQSGSSPSTGYAGNPPQGQPQNTQPVQPPGYAPNPPQVQQPYQNPNSYGGQPAPARKSSTKTIVIIVIAIVVGLTLLGVVGLIGLNALVGTQNAAKEEQSGNALTQAADTLSGNADVVDRTDGTLDVSKLVDSSQTIKAQDLKAKINQQVNLSDGTSFMVTAAERNFVSASKYLKAAEGKELVRVSIVVGNRNRQGDMYASVRNFAIVNSAGGLVQDEYATPEDLPTVFKGASISPGKQAKGDLVYEVDKGEAVSFTSEVEYKDYSTQQVVKLRAVVALQ